MADGATVRGLRDDRNVCQLCGALENLSLCGGCRDTWYCCKDHQRAHWKQHKQSCKGRQPRPVNKTRTAAAAPDTCSAGHGSGPCLATTFVEKPETASPPVTLPSVSQSEYRQLQEQLDAFDIVPDCSSVSGIEAGAQAAAGPSWSVDPSLVGLQATNISSNFATPDVLQQATPKSSKSSTKKSGSSGLRRDFVTPLQLPAIVEEGTSERFFLDARQALQSPRHSARARRTAIAGMAPHTAATAAQEGSNAYLKVMNSRFTAIAHYVVDCLTKYGICVIDQFLGEVTGMEVLSEVKQLQNRGVMRKGQLVHSTAPSAQNIRGDIITWVDGRGKDSSTENIDYLVSCMDLVIQNCSPLLERYRINERTKVKTIYNRKLILINHRKQASCNISEYISM